MINSKQKGKDGELEFCRYCRDKGFDEVRRTAQYNGKELDSKADVVGIPGIHVEVKRVQSLNIQNAMEQAIRDSEGTGEIPIVAHRKNQKKWLITMTADDWFKLWFGERDKDESIEENKG